MGALAYLSVKSQFGRSKAKKKMGKQEDHLHLLTKKQLFLFSPNPTWLEFVDLCALFCDACYFGFSLTRAVYQVQFVFTFVQNAYLCKPRI